MDDNNKIVIRRITRDARDEKTGSAEETIHVFRPSPASRWLVYLLMVPAFIIMAILGFFFFTAFLALFAIAAAVVGFRLWWLRRKMRESTSALQGEYLVVEDAEIVEERTEKADDVNSDKKAHKRYNRNGHT
ncbi:MAG: hypothetical protein KGM95_06855 [Betaproteobacteria bacterium]|nr:hypothetical protein [Betaproteobacteria bacterium]